MYLITFLSTLLIQIAAVERKIMILTTTKMLSCISDLVNNQLITGVLRSTENSRTKRRRLNSKEVISHRGQRWSSGFKVMSASHGCDVTEEFRVYLAAAGLLPAVFIRVTCSPSFPPSQSVCCKQKHHKTNDRFTTCTAVTWTGQTDDASIRPLFMTAEYDLMTDWNQLFSKPDETGLKRLYWI